MNTETQATLIACTSFLRAQVEWMTTNPDFPIDDFAEEMRLCVRALRRWDEDAQDRGTMVRCPTLLEQGECGYPLRYYGSDDHVTCKRCGAGRDVPTLIAVAMSDGREVWLDPEAASSWLGVSEGTLRQWARTGRVERSHGRYLIRHSEGATA